MASSIEEIALGRRVKNTDKRAEPRCKEYDKTNIHWKEADELLKIQDDALCRIHELTQTMNQPINKA